MLSVEILQGLTSISSHQTMSWNNPTAQRFAGLCTIKRTLWLYSLKRQNDSSYPRQGGEGVGLKSVCRWWNRGSEGWVCTQDHRTEPSSARSIRALLLSPSPWQHRGSAAVLGHPPPFVLSKERELLLCALLVGCRANGTSSTKLRGTAWQCCATRKALRNAQGGKGLGFTLQEPRGLCCL